MGPEARTAWQEGLEQSPADVTLLCRLARVESELAEDAKGEARRQLAMAAVGHARGAVKSAPEDAQAHVWLAASLGRQALQEGPKTRLALSREIKAEADRAIAIDPGIGRAWHVRALWNRGVASLNAFERAVANTVLGGVPKGASMENAVSDLRRAIELEPRYLNHHLELARTYLMMKRKAEARPHLEQVLALPPETSLRDPQYQAAARELLAKLGKD
jgi:tetratricopeptide (TPR) repeat protein